jgi:hypothetical protein
MIFSHFILILQTYSLISFPAMVEAVLDESLVDFEISIIYELDIEPAYK